METPDNTKSFSSVPSGSTNSVLSPKVKSPSPSSKSKANGKKVNSFIKKAGVELNLFLMKLKSIGAEVFNEDQLVSSLFVEEDCFKADDNRRYSANEERFLAEFNKFKSLDRMYEHRQRMDEIKSSSTTFSDTKDIRPESDNFDNKTKVDSDNRNEEDEVEEDASNEVQFNDFDFVKIRQDLPNGPSAGDSLWEYRRNKWLVASKPSASEYYFDEISKDSYVKVYNNLVDKGKSLRQDRRMNLGDLMKVVNAGWVAEAKWERAAKGLP